MKNDYTALDAAILQTLGESPMAFDAVALRVRHISNSLSRRDRLGHDAGWRLTERRLQTLRKAGKIKTDRKLWSLA